MYNSNRFDQIGSMVQVIQNEGQHYLGDLKHYFAVLCLRANNLYHPYHNLRHMLHVAWLCYDACRYYKNELSSRQRRNLMIGVLFHDFNHSGGTVGSDDENIAMALQGLRTYILQQDKPYLTEIEAIIASTRFPYTVPSRLLELVCQIARDADAAQVFSVAWIQEIIGLGKEKGIDLIPSLNMQLVFLSNMDHFQTEWAKELFEENIKAKIDETGSLLAILTDQTITW